MMDSDKPKRKPTRWQHFDYSQNRAYFITICTKDKKCILSSIVPNDGVNAPTKSVDQTVGDGALDVPMLRDGFMPTVKLTRIGEIVEKYILSTNKIENVIVDKYVIMPNHIHMIIAVRKTDVGLGTSRAPSPTESCCDLQLDHSDNDRANEIVPQVVRALKRLSNAEIGENIFQRSYYDHIIRGTEDYEETVKYILHNPRRWYLKYKIGKREVNHNE